MTHSSKAIKWILSSRLRWTSWTKQIHMAIRCGLPNISSNLSNSDTMSWMISRRFKIQSLNQIIFDTTNLRPWVLPKQNLKLLNISIKIWMERGKSSNFTMKTTTIAMFMVRCIKGVSQDLLRNSSSLSSLQKIPRNINRWMSLKCKMERSMLLRKGLLMKLLIILTSKERLLLKSKYSSSQECNSMPKWLMSH